MTTWAFHLDPHPFFWFVGPDARRFLNGMFTNNIRALVPGRLNASAMVDDKAKIQGLVDTWCTGDRSFLVGLEGVDPAYFEARYEKFIIFDDVELTLADPAPALTTLQGPEAGEVLARAGLPVPGEEGSFLTVDDVRVGRRARSKAGGFDLLAPSPLVERLVAAGAAPGGEPELEALRVEAGHARWPVDMGERALPHELRLEGRMCSFDKGCYIGQEVINRIDVMGQVQKKVWGLLLAEVPPPGTPVLLDGAQVGHTLSGVPHAGGARVLAILRKAAWTPGLEVRVGEVPAVVSDLPF